MYGNLWKWSWMPFITSIWSRKRRAGSRPVLDHLLRSYLMCKKTGFLNYTTSIDRWVWLFSRVALDVQTGWGAGGAAWTQQHILATLSMRSLDDESHWYTSRIKILLGRLLRGQDVSEPFMRLILIVPCSCRMNVTLNWQLGCNNCSGGFAMAEERCLRSFS